MACSWSGKVCVRLLCRNVRHLQTTASPQMSRGATVRLKLVVATVTSAVGGYVVYRTVFTSSTPTLSAVSAAKVIVIVIIIIIAKTSEPPLPGTQRRRTVHTYT